MRSLILFLSLFTSLSSVFASDGYYSNFTCEGVHSSGELDIPYEVQVRGRQTHFVTLDDSGEELSRYTIAVSDYAWDGHMYGMITGYGISITFLGAYGTPRPVTVQALIDINSRTKKFGPSHLNTFQFKECKSHWRDNH